MSTLVYSTESGKQKAEKKKTDQYVESKGPLKMRLETNGRGGKSVTVLFNIPMPEDEAKRLMKDMQGAFSCGATLKHSCIELRGDLRDKVKAYLEKKGVKIVAAGG